VSAALSELTTQQGEKLEAVRTTVEQRLDLLRSENTQKLEDIAIDGRGREGDLAQLLAILWT
jgi:hypothetical protein